MKYKFEPYDCFYWNKTPDFQLPPMKNIGRTWMTDSHAPAVVTNEENMEQKEKKAGIQLPEELKGKKFRIRKLTPRECFRLMGVDDEDIDKIQAFPFNSLVEYAAYSKQEREDGMTEKEKRKLMEKPISNSAQYKLAGNSIVVDVLYHIFRKMFIDTEPDVTKGDVRQLELF